MKACNTCEELLPLSNYRPRAARCRKCDYAKRKVDGTSNRGQAHRVRRKRESLSTWSWFNRHRDRWCSHVSRGGKLSYEEYVIHQEARQFGWTNKVGLTNWVRRHKSKAARLDNGMTAAQKYHHRYHSDPDFNSWERLRNQFNKWHRGGRASSLINTLGYTRHQLKCHLEGLFTCGMSWENYGVWHIDHIIPKNLFDPNDPIDVQQCWALENLRPLWAADNLQRPRDGSDLDDEYKPLLFDLNCRRSMKQYLFPL